MSPFQPTLDPSLAGKTNTCRVTHEGGHLRVVTPYRPDFVELIKTLPRSERSYDPSNKSWLIDVQHHRSLRAWIATCFDEDIGEMQGTTVQPKTETRILDVWYLGRTKPSGDEPQATGMNQSRQWVYLFPEAVLKLWFEGTTNLTAKTTLYGLLSIQRNASPDEIKSAFRRMTIQWHPDVNQEPNAAEIYLRIKEAYEVLGNPNRRARYDAGLALVGQMENQPNNNFKSHADQILGYRSPLRCGYVLAEGIEKLGRFVVGKIHQWEDIRTNQGTLVTSWDMNKQNIVERWA
jgi:hypothetical protein